ncbi:3-deoxy-manno-octulosonate cytidylyltransferase [Candidatus Pelagibacter sp.]|uniref:3-deoxy-manno-octulosonate cytidylyltransferase n=1 Tax=Candidatus Pelagibacter sp. TaxID=2024849 RepID=UPI003F85DEFB
MIIGLIPSRLNSKRLKEKPLIKIDGLPIIIHSFKRSKLSKKLDDVIVCTDHKKIIDVVNQHGGKAMMTSKKHKNGTERIYEVAKKIKSAELIIDIQGDQPLIDPKAIDKTVDFHKKNKHFDIVLGSMPINEGPENKSLVKNIFSNNKIIYFSREKTPYNYNKKKIKYYKNLSIISFKPEALKKFCKSNMTKLEKIEGIELMRALELGLNIGTFIIKGSDFAVDVKIDLFKAISIMPKDKIRKLY